MTKRAHKIVPRFRRSIRIDSDLGSRSALEDFHCSPSFKAVLRFMAAHIADTGQGAFTWTGPYGGGKSSLALAFASLFDTSPEVVEAASARLGDEAVSELAEAIPEFSGRFKVAALVVERRSIAAQLAEAFELGSTATSQEILSAINQRADTDGVLIVLDELGRGLEAAAEGDGDIHLLQDLAECASRAQGRLIVIGILHQSFEEYAARLERATRDTWAKIQGRFVDISVAITIEETIGLMAEALGHRRASSRLRPLCEEAVGTMRPAPSQSVAAALSQKLARCRPLHPVTALLLPPLSRRKFGQNQRSVFSFLYSAEPFGLQDFGKEEEYSDHYPPDLLWDYLQANFEPAILASSDAKRWLIGQDALERCMARGGEQTELRLLKTIALLDFLQGRCGLVADEATLCVALDECPEKDVRSALLRLKERSEVVYRRHAGVYRMYAGSDFDVDAHIEELLAVPVKVDLESIRALADLQPVLAKRHHIETGAMHWFDVRLTTPDLLAQTPELASNYFGEIVLVLPATGFNAQSLAKKLLRSSRESAGHPVAFGLLLEAPRILGWCEELVALQGMEGSFPELRGDPVARREIDARIADLRRDIETQLAATLESSDWFIAGKRHTKLTKRELNDQLSKLVAGRLSAAPTVRNELLNCDEPSSNAVSARTKLMKAMVRNEGKDALGFGGKNFPAERGLYVSLLDDHELVGAEGFSAPGVDHHLHPLWARADDLLESADGMIDGAQILDAWHAEPIGLKRGLGPVFLVAYILSRRDRVASYCDGLFQAQFNDLCVEFLARDPSDIGLRRIELDGFIGATLAALAGLIQLEGVNSPLAVARAIVEDYDRLVPWTKRTQALSAQALKLRETLKRASDPNKLLFDDLPGIAAETGHEGPDAAATARLVRDLMAELRAAYPKVLAGLKELLLRELDVRGENEEAYALLRARAENVRQIAGDLRLEAFVGRLSQFHGTREDIEGLAAIAADKLPRDWNDTDRQRAGLGIAELSAKFLRIEALAHVNGRPDKRRALALIVQNEDRTSPIVGEYQVAEADFSNVAALVRTVEMALLESDCGRREVILAALAEVTSKYLDESDPCVRLKA
ncbi:MAG: ATP-binding protein [Pseudomonadota bacterium]